ncbi:MAG TPA: ribonuclease PH [Candidatus Hydrothermia bacterium]|nr:ribonuclease PH [Candidatus Hydrothermae bacterium]MDD3648783.1 ribonuclease PH [Candidatus Hydrothermia bacterium]MDD5572395.1 ribonuclease PH [Candidatus Hydrothermia bacterium]HOK23288.1 ribonuclease PH [Candidatus Hydrothermia bacterium]HOL24097.1 ribonuclease PH [Candidatus Hydrothermia bacterium]
MKEPLELRPIKFTRNYLKNPEGSCLIEMGNTIVLCTASVQNKAPAWLQGTGQGWITAEYGMLPRSTQERKQRESRIGKPDSRAIEISRIIGRSLRGVVDLSKLGDFTIIIDCDVLQADGGTRTASINGGFVALSDAISFLMDQKLINENPVKEFIGSVSVGIVNEEYYLDLSYDEDSQAQVDLNVTMTETGKVIDIQGTAEKRPLERWELNELIEIAIGGISKIIAVEKEVLKKRG